MPARKKTSFDKFVDDKMKDVEFASGYRQAKRDIDVVDRIVRALDKARVDLGMSKAELARRISAKPEIVRRLLTEEHANPTMATVVKVAGAVGLRVELVPSAAGRRRATGRRTSGSVHAA
jgi:DNA-binding phage protein